MKNFKRILALVLTLMFIVGSCASLSAFSGSTTTSWYAGAVSWIEDTGVDTIGVTAGDKIDRETFVKWVAKIESTYVNDDLWDDEVASTSFDDVTEENYRAAIAYSQQRGFIRGYDAKTFGPKDTLTFAQACAVIVRVLGCESWVEDQSANNWEYNYINIANKLGAIDSTWVGKVGFYVPAHEMTKGETAYLLWKAAHDSNGHAPDASHGHPVYRDGETGKVIGYFGKMATKTVSYLAMISTLECERLPIVDTDATRNATYVAGQGDEGAVYLMRYTDGTQGDGTSFYIAASESGILTNPSLAKFWEKKNYQAYYNRAAYSKTLDTKKAVKFILFDEKGFVGEEISMDAATFQKLLRKGAGLSENVGPTETYSVFDSVRVGSVVNLVYARNANGTVGNCSSIKTVNQHIVDTYRIFKTTSNTVVYNAGLANAYGSNSNLAAMPTATYDATKDVTSWSKDGKKLTLGSQEYTILAPGKAYSGAAGELKVYGYKPVQLKDGGAFKFYDKTTGTAVWAGVAYADADETTTFYTDDDLTIPSTVTYDKVGAWKEAVDGLVELTAAEAKAQILNAAEGEVSTVYSDMDGDGLYDVVAVLDYDKFTTAQNLNANPGNDPQVKGVPGTGTVVLNKTVTAQAGSNTDAWMYSATPTGKMQLILNTHNKYNLNAFQKAAYDGYGKYFVLMDLDETTEDLVDLAEFKTGYIKNATSAMNGGYYTLTITTADGDITAKMPGIGFIPTTQTMSYTAYGASASQTLSSKGWVPFLSDFYAANFEYAYLDANGKYLYKDAAGNEFYDADRDIVAYYKGAPVHTIVPAGVTAQAGVEYSVATIAGNTFSTATESYEVVKDYKEATAFVTGTHYYKASITEFEDAMDDLIDWKSGVSYTTKDVTEPWGEHRNLATFESGVTYYVASGTDKVTTTDLTPVSSTVYYTENPESYSLVDTAETTIKYADITKYYVGDAHTPATYTDFTFAFESGVDYYVDGVLQSKTSFDATETYYTKNGPDYATHTNLEGTVTEGYFTYVGTVLTAVTVGSEFVPTAVYYTVNPDAYTVAAITAFDANTTYYTYDGSAYVVVDQAAVVDPTKAYETVAETVKVDAGITTAEQFASATDTLYTCTVSYVAADSEVDGKEYVTFTFATPAVLSPCSFVTGTIYAVQDVSKTLVNEAEKKALGTSTDFIDLTRQFVKVEGYKGEQPAGTTLLSVKTDEGVYGATDEAIYEKVSAWMTGKYIDFVLDANNNIIVALDTVDTSKTTEGFVINATKGDANTYKINLAKTGSAINNVTTYPIAATTLEELHALRYSGSPNNGVAVDPAVLKAAIYDESTDSWTGWIRVHNDQYNAFLTMPESWVISRMGGANIAAALSKVFAAKISDVLAGSVGVASYTVRASASSIMDIANSAQYRAIYGGSVTTGVTKAGDKFSHKNLIYVSMSKDAGEYSIMRVIEPSKSEQVTEGVEQTFFVNYNNDPNHNLSRADVSAWRLSNYMYTKTTVAGEGADAAWFVPENGVLLSSEKVLADNYASFGLTSAYVSGTKSADNSTPYTEYYFEQIGTNPYYRLDASKKFETVFANVSTRVRTVVYTPEIDSVTGGRYVLVQNASGEAISATSADAKKISGGNNNYLAIGGKLFWQLEKGTAKYAGAYTTEESVSALTAYATNRTLKSFKDAKGNYTYSKASMALLSGKAMKRSDKGYIPGYYTITVDGKTYTTAGSTKVIVMTPNSTKVVGQIFTVKELIDNGEILFATEYQIAYTGSNMTALTVIGELVDRTVKTEQPKVVYLGTSATTILEAEETGTSYIVRTSVPAYNLDGTEFGCIYYKYDTTASGFESSVFEFLLSEGGRFFEVKPDGQIINGVGTLYSTSDSVANANINKGKMFSDFINGQTVTYKYEYPCLADALNADYFSSAKITSVADGAIIADLYAVNTRGETYVAQKGVDITDWNVKFIYTDFDGEQLMVAGDNTAVSIYSFDVAVSNALYSSLKTEAQAAALYEIYKGTSAKADYQAALTAASEAVAAAKVAAADKYFNGAFWGTGSVSSSPLAVYFGKVKDSFGMNASVTFKYIVQDDVTYVLVPTFVLG